MRRCMAVLIGLVIAMILGAGAFIYSGIYDISATEPHWGITKALLGIARDRSVAAHSKGITVPNLEEPGLVITGFIHYHAMCRLCHGAPGFTENEFAKGLYPAPPNLAPGTVQQALGDAQLFWVIKNGLKMTGMPAFGPTHGEADLWGVVGFVKALPGLKAEDYRQRITKLGLPSEEVGHRGQGEKGHHD
jgi:mono/diheme cytochrome c family protein